MRVNKKNELKLEIYTRASIELEYTLSFPAVPRSLSLTLSKQMPKAMWHEDGAKLGSNNLID